MKKADHYQLNKAYWEENQRMLDEPTYEKKLKQDRLTTTDLMKRELYELTQKQQENESAKIEAAQRAKKEKEREEREEFEKWKRQKAEIADKNTRTQNARTE